MTSFEISLAQAYLAKSRQDPVTALIRSVRDLARMRALLAGGPELRHGRDRHAGAADQLRQTPDSVDTAAATACGSA